jgi:hypothetical protein
LVEFVVPENRHAEPGSHDVHDVAAAFEYVPGLHKDMPVLPLTGQK